MRTKSTRKGPYKSGYCLYAPHQYPCKGEFQNGANVQPRTRLCSCPCHGDYTERMLAAGLTVVESDPETEGEDNEDDD